MFGKVLRKEYTSLNGNISFNLSMMTTCMQSSHWLTTVWQQMQLLMTESTYFLFNICYTIIQAEKCIYEVAHWSDCISGVASCVQNWPHQNDNWRGIVIRVTALKTLCLASQQANLSRYRIQFPGWRRCIMYLTFSY